MMVGDVITSVINGNIQNAKICRSPCRFCAFSKGKSHENPRGKPYNFDMARISRRVKAAWDWGATEVCMQGGSHPAYTGETYLEILKTVRFTYPRSMARDCEIYRKYVSLIMASRECYQFFPRYLGQNDTPLSHSAAVWRRSRRHCRGRQQRTRSRPRTKLWPEPTKFFASHEPSVRHCNACKSYRRYLHR